MCSDLSETIRIGGSVGTLCILTVMVFVFSSMGGKESSEKGKVYTNIDQNARVNRASRYPDKPDYSARLQSAQVQNGRVQGNQMQNSRVQGNQMQNSQMQNSQIQNNPLDRKPMSVEKREQHERNRIPATKVVLINEEGRPLMDWSLERKTSLIIGKNSDKEPVDIDLSGSAVAQMISKQHAVLNYTEAGWYIDDIDSKNGTRVKKATQNSIMDVKLVGAIEIEAGDIIYIANTMLQIQ